jgi:Domain of unknown function (DUF1931)
VGALSLALARTFKVIDADLRNPPAGHRERSFRIFDLLLQEHDQRLPASICVAWQAARGRRCRIHDLLTRRM